MKNISQIHFEAILAKNCIAREMAQVKLSKGPVCIDYILDRLEEIEMFIGHGNQPGVRNIYEVNSNNSKYTI